MKTKSGRCSAVLIVNHCVDVSGQVHAPAVPPLKNDPVVPSEQEAGGPDSRSGCFEDRLISCLCRESNPCSCSQYHRHYTDYAILAPSFFWHIPIYLPAIYLWQLYNWHLYMAWQGQCILHSCTLCSTHTLASTLLEQPSWLESTNDLPLQ